MVSHPLTGDLSPAAVSYTSGFYHIPVIGISSRDSAFSDKVNDCVPSILDDFMVISFVLEYSCIFSKDSPTILAPSRCLGRIIEIFQLQKGYIHS